MSKSLFFFIFFLVFVSAAFAQTNPDTLHHSIDSLSNKDSLVAHDTLAHLPSADSTVKKALPDSAWDHGSLLPFIELKRKALLNHPYFAFSGPLIQKEKPVTREVHGKDLLFYVLILILILFGLLRRVFAKYFADLFRLFFRTTLKQRQIKEQLMQTPLPSILLNGFFVISAGLYASFLLQYFALDPTGNFWKLFGYCSSIIATVYFLKFVGLKIAGWIFNQPEAADSYIFVVFIINKMIGILLLPFLVLLAFATSGVYLAAITLSWCLVGGLLVYRFILTYSSVRNQVSINIFHFFLYLCAFEVAPLLLIYKALVLFFNLSP